MNEKNLPPNINVAKDTKNKISSNLANNKAAINPTPAKKKKKFLILLIFIMLVLCAMGGLVGFKYMEHQTLQKFVALHNERLVKEVEQVYEVNQLVDEFFYQEEDEKKDEDKDNKKTPNTNEIVTKFNKMQDNLVVLEDQEKDAIKLLEESQQLLEQFYSKNKVWLLGSRAVFVEGFIDNLGKFYQTEVNDINNNLVYFRFSYNQLALSKNAKLFAQFMDDTNGLHDEDAIGDHFQDLAPFEKYSREDFAYDEEEKIEELFPYGYESLEKQRLFFKNFYLAIKDLVAGDEDSAYYKLSRMGEDYADLNTIDEDRMKDELKKISADLKKTLAETLVKRLAFIRQFNNDKMGEYPVLGSAGEWQTDLAACYVLVYKNDLYSTVQSGYPQDASNLSELLVKLNQISPKTDEISEYFIDESLEFSRDEKYIYTTCKDTKADKTYQLKYKDHQAEEEEKEEEAD